MTNKHSVLFTSVHKGPFLSLRPVEKALGSERIHYLASGPTMHQRAKEELPYFECDPSDLVNFFTENDIRAVVRGTSVLTDEISELNTEKLAARVAEKLGIPVIVVEDFPGNYRLNPDERLDCLCVGEESTINIHQDRGVDGNLIINTGNPRYNALSNINRDQLRARTKATLGLTEYPVVLWAGQPDGENSYLALERLLPCLSETRATLLFRAHPRDSAFASGRYKRQLLEVSPKVIDVTTYPDSLGLCCASDLVVTQFSTLAVEASYLGVPALFVLYDDLGKDYLRTLYGYDTLPWSANRCAFLIEEEAKTEEVFKTALLDESARRLVLANFQENFPSHVSSANVIADRIMALAGSGRETS